MSLPAELRVLCLQLSSAQPEDLPRLTPTLLRHVLRCQTPLSTVSSNSGKADASATAVQVHKLKTQLSTLLNGRSPEGRFTAVVLIKAVVEVGGWEVLRTAEPWVRGILAILGKPLDPVATKELCIVALTKIYCMTHPYQSLVREMTTPTLPTFIAACLNLVSSKASGKAQDVPSSLIETIFRCFTTLMPRHTTIFRPFTSQIRIVTRSYLAPTMSDGLIVSSSVVDSARSLVVALHQTVAKNGGGEEWAKSVRELVKDIHATADLVFRAVVEDWESTTGHISQNVDVNQELSGGDITSDTLPRWEGITAGVERLVGLIGLLEEYFKGETSSAVVVPIGSIIDMTMRMLWIVMPSSGTEHGGARLHPAVDRDEKDGLWSGLPQIYIAALQLIGTIVDRLGVNFTSLASGILDHITWILPSGKSIPEFRQQVYILVSKLLPMLDGSISKSGVSKLSPLIRCCCKDLQHLQPGSTTKENLPMMGDRSGKPNGKNPNSNGANSNADSFLQTGVVSPIAIQVDDPALTAAAEALLPLFLSHLPQQFIDLSVRALIERTAILTHHQDAMVASVINPFIGKDGNAAPSILPHLARTYPNDDVVEVLLRPRMAVLPSASTRFAEVDLQEEEPMMDAPLESIVESMQTDDHDATANSIDTETKQNTLPAQQQLWGVPSVTTLPSTGEGSNATVAHSTPTQAQTTSAPAPLETGDVEMDDSDSDDESVHMTGQLDDLSEDDSS